MATTVTKYTEEELQTIKLKEISSVISGKLTDEEKETLKTKTVSAERRAYLIELYNKYIDEVILESNKEAADEAAKKAAEETDATEKASEEKADTTETESATEKLSDPTVSNTVNTNISFTVDIRGISGHNGTFTYTCDKLLLLAFRNPKSSITFRNAQRANQFIEIVKSVSHVKGISMISNESRAAVIARLKTVNGL